MKNKLLMPIIVALAVVISLVFFLKFSDNDQKINDKTPISVENEKTQDQTPKSEGNAVAIDNVKLTLSEVGNETQKPETKKVTFAAAGDIICHTTVLADARDHGANKGQEFDFLPMFENVADIIKNADIAYINQESPYGGTEDRGYDGYPMFNTPDQEGLDLMELGFDIVNLANNHMLDSGTKGYQRTIDFWKKYPEVTYIGGYENKEDYENIRVIEKNGISIALLSYTYGTNGLSLKKGSEMIIPLCDDSGTAEIDRMTKRAREMADIVIVSMHWGYEDHFTPSALQQEQMQVMVDNGVDVIIGTHPHVLQPMTWKEGPDGRRTLVIYSLGNFLSGMLYMRNMVGGIAEFELVKVGDKAFVDNPSFTPTVCHNNVNWRKFKIYKFSDYTQALLNGHRCQNFSDPGNTLEGLRSIIDKTIPNEFLKEDFYRN